MNIYLVTRQDDWGYDGWGYDKYDSYVAIADTEKDAIKLAPWDHEIENIEIQKIGESNLSSQLILASFNAG